ncbi:MAG TPA: hypothetical protein VIU61_14465 [Kofleriaceae bacterium]
MFKVVLFVLLAACSVGEVPLDDDLGGVDAGSNGDPNEASFNATIKPLVTACLGCHSAAQVPRLTSYAELAVTYKTKPGSTNILVTKGDATGGIHQAQPYFNAAQKTTVAGWIDGLQ